MGWPPLKWRSSPTTTWSRSALRNGPNRSSFQSPSTNQAKISPKSATSGSRNSPVRPAQVNGMPRARSASIRGGAEVLTER